MRASLPSSEPTLLLYGATVGTMPESRLLFNASTDLSLAACEQTTAGKFGQQIGSKDASHTDNDG